MARRQFADSFEDRSRWEHRPEGKQLVERDHIQFPADRRIGEDGLDLRGEEEGATRHGVKKRNDAEAVARKKKLSIAAVPNGEGPLSIAVLDALFTVDFIKPKNHLGIGSCPEPVAFAYQFLSEFQVIEDLPVKSNPKRSIVVGHGLPATR